MLELGLKGKAAIVTGGSEGLGRATADRLAREGVRAAICARRKDVREQRGEASRRARGGGVFAQAAEATRRLRRRGSCGGGSARSEGGGVGRGGGGQRWAG